MSSANTPTTVALRVNAVIRPACQVGRSSSGQNARMGFDRLHHMQLAMPKGEEAAARAFFVDVLGMDEVAKPPVLAARGGAWFRAGGIELHLGVEDDFRPARKGHPGLLVDDLDDIAARLTAAGQDASWDADFPGFRRIYAHDPFGNRLEFLEPLA